MSKYFKFLPILCLPATILAPVAVFCSSSLTWVPEVKDFTTIDLSLKDLVFSNEKAEIKNNDAAAQVGFYWDNQIHNKFYTESINVSLKMQKQNTDKTYRNWTKQEICEWVSNPTPKTLKEVCPAGILNRNECADKIVCSNHYGKNSDGDTTAKIFDGINIKNTATNKVYKLQTNPIWSNNLSSGGFKEFFNDSLWQKTRDDSNYYYSSPTQTGGKITDSSSFKNFKSKVVNNEYNYNYWCFTKFCTQWARPKNYVTISNICFYLDPAKIIITPEIDRSKNTLSLKVKQTSCPWTVFVNSYYIKNVTDEPYYSTQISKDFSTTTGYAIVSLELLNPKTGFKTSSSTCNWWCEYNTNWYFFGTDYLSWLYKTNKQKQDSGAACGSMAELKDIDFSVNLTNGIVNPLDE